MQNGYPLRQCVRENTTPEHLPLLSPLPHPPPRLSSLTSPLCQYVREFVYAARIDSKHKTDTWPIYFTHSHTVPCAPGTMHQARNLCRRSNCVGVVARTLILFSRLQFTLTESVREHNFDSSYVQYNANWLATPIPKTNFDAMLRACVTRVQWKTIYNFLPCTENILLPHEMNKFNLWTTQ